VVVEDAAAYELLDTEELVVLVEDAAA